MSMYLEQPNPIPHRPEQEGPYQSLQRAVDERFDMGYNNYYMRRMRAADQVRYYRQAAKYAQFTTDKVLQLDHLRQWKEILLNYCSDEHILNLEREAAKTFNQPWMIEAQITALHEARDQEDEPPR